MSAGHKTFPTFKQGLAVTALAFACQLVGVVGGVIGMILLRTRDTMEATLVATILAGCLSTALVLNWAKGVRREPLRLVVALKPVAPVPLTFALFATFGADVVLSQIANWLGWLIPPGPSFRRLMAPLEQGSLPLVIASAVVVGPVVEELIFRGVVLRGFLENYRLRSAILVSSLLFAFLHLNPWQSVTSFFIGCLFALFVARTGSLLPAIAGHVLCNGLALVAMRSHARIPGLTMEGLQPWWLVALGVLLTAGGIVAFYRATSAGRGLDSEGVS